MESEPGVVAGVVKDADRPLLFRRKESLCYTCFYYANRQGIDADIAAEEEAYEDGVLQDCRFAPEWYEGRLSMIYVVTSRIRRLPASQGNSEIGLTRGFPPLQIVISSLSLDSVSLSRGRAFDFGGAPMRGRAGGTACPT